MGEVEQRGINRQTTVLAERAGSVGNVLISDRSGSAEAATEAAGTGERDRNVSLEAIPKS
jgi:hypothetical protein